jgi:endo-1,4-beta-D-glucanase Y
MCWLVENNGTKRSTAATDADEDVAMALIFADRQWGSGGEINYLEEARTVVSNLAFIIRADNWFFPPADSGTNSTTEIEFRKDKVFNPSYFSPAWYREFYELTGDPVWTNCLAGSYSVIGGFLNTYTNGIVPDWCDPVTLGPCTIAPYNQQGYYNTYITNSTYCTLDYVMDYDGYRIGWRLGLDYLWNGDPLAQSNCTALARFMDETTAGRPNKINAYLPDGTRIVGSWNDLAYTAPVTVAAMADANGQAWLDTLCTSLTNDYTGTSFDKYFGRAQQLFAMLMLSGNFHNLGEESSPVVPPDPEPQPDPELIQNPGFVTDTTGWKLQSGPVHSSEYPGEDAGSVKMQGDDSYMYIEQKVESITPGQTYDFSASIYTENLPKGENATLKVQWGKADYSRHSDTWIDSTDTAGRSTLEGSATAPADAVRAFVICSLSGTSTGTVWFDNISMQEQ